MTTSDLATVQPPAAAPVASQTVRNLAQWASELDHAYAIAKTICGTKFVPEHFRGQPEECAAAILYGDTLGLAPMVAVRSIYSVHGTPALYAQAMYAIALAAGHQIERVHADDSRVEFRCRPRSGGAWQKVEWTIERAKRAGYTTNKKYQENPVGMLTEKCKAEAAKLVAPAELSGLNSVEEIILGDYEESPIIDLGEAEPPKQRTAASRLLPPAEAPAPPAVDVETGEVTEAAPEPAPRASEAQIKLLVTVLNAAGHTTSRQKAAAIADKLGETKAPHELTPEDADLLIQLFEADAARSAEGGQA